MSASLVTGGFDALLNPASTEPVRARRGPATEQEDRDTRCSGQADELSALSWASLRFIMTMELSVIRNLREILDMYFIIHLIFMNVKP